MSAENTHSDSNSSRAPVVELDSLRIRSPVDGTSEDHADVPAPGLNMNADVPAPGLNMNAEVPAPMPQVVFDTISVQEAAPAVAPPPPPEPADVIPPPPPPPSTPYVNNYKIKEAFLPRDRNWNLNMLASPGLFQGSDIYPQPSHPWADLLEEVEAWNADNWPPLEIEQDFTHFREVTPNGHTPAFVAQTFNVQAGSTFRKVNIFNVTKPHQIWHLRQQAEEVRGHYIKQKRTDRMYENLNLPIVEKNVYELKPRVVDGFLPCLYRVVGRNSGVGNILECVNFEMFLPDRPQFRTVVLDQFGHNIAANGRGYRWGEVSNKDLVWVYAVDISHQALQNPPAAWDALHVANVIPENQIPFLRAAQFSLVPIVTDPAIQLSYCFHTDTRGDFTGRRRSPRSYKIVVNGTPQVTTVPALAIPGDFRPEDDSLLNCCPRADAPATNRFSTTPVSQQALQYLQKTVEKCLPFQMLEAPQPAHIAPLTEEDRARVRDRNNQLNIFTTDIDEGVRILAHTARLASSVACAMECQDEVVGIREARCCIQNFSSPKLLVRFTVMQRSTEAGYVAGREVSIIIAQLSAMMIAKIEEANLDNTSKALVVHARIRSDHTSKYGGILEDVHKCSNDGTFNALVRLLPIPQEVDNTRDALQELEEHPPAPDTTAFAILNCIYNAEFETDEARLLGSSIPKRLERVHVPSSFLRNNSAFSRLNQEQRNTLKFALSNVPVAAVQASFGTGKTTVLAAMALVRAANPSRRNEIVWCVAPTNSAALQIVESLQQTRAENFPRILRFVADRQYNHHSHTNVDIQELMCNVKRYAKRQFSTKEARDCHEFAEKRRTLNRFQDAINMDSEFLEDDEQRYCIAERVISKKSRGVTGLLMENYNPQIIVSTVGSAINLVGEDGMFAGSVNPLNVGLILADEATMISEASMLSLITRFPDAQLALVGDFKQLAPHCRMRPERMPARWATTSALQVATRSQKTTRICLTKTYRCHPGLLDLPNTCFYAGTLSAGASSESRRTLVDAVAMPSLQCPSLLIDTSAAGQAFRAPSRSLFNEAELNTCVQLVNNLLDAGVRQKNIACIVYYTEQGRRLQSALQGLDVQIITVDSAQGREFEIVIVLTTRTSTAASETVFIGSATRACVALTRCKW